MLLVKEIKNCLFGFVGKSHYGLSYSHNRSVQKIKYRHYISTVKQFFCTAILYFLHYDPFFMFLYAHFSILNIMIPISLHCFKILLFVGNTII
ncbi:hypothetical protein GDO86_001985 [Hymenochirus boettgeri]|uniref:Uncharacterized protein n=1 Tax=Hymenochirus boettgeri TaxID=247094 RepID=A0A8T2KEZ6_9PIPI|nr:hypothetical protein GDO86_001985 [Hymenochirus boettgeri]